jgi:hypothetical protein
MSGENDVAEIKRALSDPTRVLEALGMLGQGKARARQAGGWLIRCPVHNETTPSCSVQQRDGVILWKCWGCSATGDVLTLVAAAYNLKIGADFRSVILEAARLAGLWHVVDRLEGREPREPRPAPPTRPEASQEPPRPFPPQGEVEALWAACVPTSDDIDVAAYLQGRSLEPGAIDVRDLARALPPDGSLPRWARYRGSAPESRSWRELGYRLVIPVFDPTGVMRSVRVARIGDGDGPKRLPPSGHKASELCMLDPFALRMVRGEWSGVRRVAIVEGEPDLLAQAIVSNDPHVATIGIVSGSWTSAWSDIVPEGSAVFLLTHNDQAGDRYANEIRESLTTRRFGCTVYRGQPL